MVQCTRTGQVMLDFEDAKSLMDVIRDYYNEHKAEKAPSIRQLYFGKGYPGIQLWTAVPYENIAPAEASSHGRSAEALRSEIL